MKGIPLTFFLEVLILVHQWGPSVCFKANIADKLKLFFGMNEAAYSIVINCGDVKTLLGYYQFIPTKDGTNIKLNKEFFKISNSSVYENAAHPQKFIPQLEELIDHARRDIPKANWPKTPIILMGNSGFKKLTNDILSELLPALRRSLKHTGFQVQENSVVIVDDEDEGLLNWFTLNLMLGNMNRIQQKAAVVLKMGPTTNQVTFLPSETDNIGSAEEHFLFKILSFNRNIRIYNRRFPGFGIEDARKKIIEMGKQDSSGVYDTDCIAPGIRGNWEYNGVTYKVRGSFNTDSIQLKTKGLDYSVTVVDIQRCESTVKKVLRYFFNKCPNLSGKKVYGLSAYFYRFVDAGLVDFVRGGWFSMRELDTRVRYNCMQANISQAFLCMDLMYINVMLRDVYGLSERDEIKLTNRVKKKKLHWMFGAAYLSLLQFRSQFK